MDRSDSNYGWPCIGCHVLHMERIMEEIMEQYSTTFFDAVQEWPTYLQLDIYNLYAYLRAMDEFVENDVMHEDMQGIHERFMQVADKYEFDEQWIKDFDKAMFSDLLVYEHTISSMLEYCKGSAEAVGCMVARMLGCPPEAEGHARALGRAYQIINFIRDYDDDIQRGYKYITDDHSIYLKMFNEELDKGMAGLKYIPEHLQGAIIASSIQYMEIADNCEATLL